MKTVDEMAAKACDEMDGLPPGHYEEEVKIIADAFRPTFDAMQEEIKRLQDQDSHELDGTDAAHPAWLRGDDHGAKAACRVIQHEIDNGPDGGVACRVIEEIRIAIRGMKSEIAEQEKLLEYHERQDRARSMFPCPTCGQKRTGDECLACDRKELREYRASSAQRSHFECPACGGVRFGNDCIGCLRKRLELADAVIWAGAVIRLNHYPARGDKCIVFDERLAAYDAAKGDDDG